MFFIQECRNVNSKFMNSANTLRIELVQDNYLEYSDKKYVRPLEMIYVDFNVCQSKSYQILVMMDNFIWCSQ